MSKPELFLRLLRNFPFIQSFNSSGCVGRDNLRVMVRGGRRESEAVVGLAQCNCFIVAKSIGNQLYPSLDERFNKCFANASRGMWRGIDEGGVSEAANLNMMTKKTSQKKV